MRAERTSERGAAVAATFLLIAALSLDACTERAPERRATPAPTTGDIVIDPNDIAVADFGGFGAEWDPYTNSANPKVPAVVTERIAFMRLPFVRVRMFASWYADADNHYDFSNRAMRPLYELLDAAKANGTDVILTEWGSDDWSQDPWPIDDPRYAIAVADGLDHLIRRRGYTNIRHVVVVNEPNHVVTLPMWTTALVNLDRELRARDLLGLVRILGPDLGNRPWPAASLADVADLMSAWDQHIYPEPEDVRAGRTEAALRSAWERVRSSLAGWTAPFVLGESGFATWGHSDPAYAVDMVDYAIQATRAGTSMMSAWMLDDESYPDGLDSQPPKWFGMWSPRASGSALKPWFYTWSLLCRLVRPGSTLYLATQPTDIRVLGAHDSSSGRWTFVIVNRRPTVAKGVTIRVPGGGAVRYRRYLFDGRDGTGPRDANGFPVPFVSGRSGDLERGISVTLPPDSVAFVAADAG